MAFSPRRLMRGASGAGGQYQISRSLRFNSADSAYLNRTPASAGNKQTWTLSVWVKRGSLSAFNPIFTAGPVSPRGLVLLQSDNKLQVRQVDSTDTEVIRLVTTQVFRDPSAWYHIVVAQDTTQATSSNRVKVYVNGTQVTAFDTATYPNQNISNLAINDALEHNYGRYVNSPSDGYLSAYLTETNFIDGQALTPSSFGETNAQTGVWQPKAYSGSYGTNGFYLNFSDNSNTTAATLGKDYSGNGNNWTPNGFSVTAGAGNDSLVDTPTPYGTDTGVGGEVRGNYCTLNPLYVNGAGTPAITNGNLDMLAGGTGDSYFGGTIPVSSGKWYYECLINAVGTGGTSILIGICKTSAPNSIGNIGSYRSTSEIYNLDGTTQTAGANYSNGQTIGVAIDIDAGTVQFYKNNVAQGATPSFTFTAGTEVFVRGRSDSANPSATFNFGQRPFTYTAPSGFKALCTQNLPTPTIGATTATQAGKYFNTVLYTGNGATQTIGGVGFQPDFLWVKSRSNAHWNSLLDVLRGRAKTLFTNVTNAEFTSLSDKEVTAFTSDGFSLGPDNDYSINSSGATFVAWNWKAGGTGVNNTSGQISSTVSANPTAGFSIVQFTTDGTTKTVGHGLGVKPSLVIVKVRNGAGSWITMTDIIDGSMQYAVLQTDSAFSSIAYSAPTSSVFSYNDNNNNTQIAYCFTSIAGYSKIGTYTGNGSSNGPFVFTGFRPAWVLFKGTGAGTNWFLFDSKRSTYNIVINLLYPNAANAENTAGSGYVDLTSNGFKIRTVAGDMNSSATYIYMAFAENPFKYSLAR